MTASAKTKLPESPTSKQTAQTALRMNRTKWILDSPNTITSTIGPWSFGGSSRHSALCRGTGVVSRGKSPDRAHQPLQRTPAPSRDRCTRACSRNIGKVPERNLPASRCRSGLRNSRTRARTPDFERDLLYIKGLEKRKRDAESLSQ